MTGEQGKAQLRVELANKGELKEFFAQGAKDSKAFGDAVKQGTGAAAKGVDHLTQEMQGTAAAAAKARDAQGRFVEGAGGARRATEGLTGALSPGNRAVVDLSRNMNVATRSSATFASTLGGSLRSALGGLSSSAASAARGLAALAGLGAGAGLVTEVKNVIDLDDAIVGVAATAGMADDQIASLRKQILDTSVATQQFGKDIADAVQAYVAKTGDMQTARENIALYAKTAKAARADVSEIANIGADLQKLKITDKARAFAILAKQSDVGAVELKDLVSQGPRLLSAFQGAGLVGEKGLREGGAFAQVAQSATGNVERTSTAVEATFRDMAEKAGLLKQLGINVFDPKTHLARDRVDVLQEMIRKFHGREDMLRGIFGDEAMRGVIPMAADFRDTGRFTRFEQFRDVPADQAIMDRKFALNTSTAAAKIQKAQVQLQADAARNLGDSINHVADQMDRVPRALAWMREHPWGSAGIAAGAFTAYQGAKYGLGRAAGYVGSRALPMLFGGGGGAAAEGGGGALSALAGAAGAALPVKVVNWPGGIPGIGGGGDGVGSALVPAAAQAAKGLLRTGVGDIMAGSAGAIATAAASVLVAGAAGYALGTLLDNTFHISDKLAGLHTKADGSAPAPGEGITVPEVGTFGDDADRVLTAATNERGLAGRLTAQVRAGKITAAQAVAEFTRFARSAEGNVSPEGLSDGRDTRTGGDKLAPDWRFRGQLNARALLAQLGGLHSEAEDRATTARNIQGALSDLGLAGVAARVRAGLSGAFRPTLGAEPVFGPQPQPAPSELAADFLRQLTFKIDVGITDEEVRITTPSGTRTVDRLAHRSGT